MLSQYRISFHERVQELLAAEGIDYRLIYSDPVGDAAAKGDTRRLDWARCVPVKAFDIARQRLFWQSAMPHLVDADLTIVSQENKLLLNYWLQARSLIGRRKIAFFGHGQSSASSRFPRIAGTLKRFLATRVDWWFAYTPGVADLLAAYGYPADRITINYNSIDTEALDRELTTVGEDEIAAFRATHGLGAGRTGLYVGSLYADKRIAFLIEAAQRIRQKVPDFQLIVVGSGPQADIVEGAARSHDFIHATGPLFGRDKAVALRSAHVCLLPGAVGLAVLDTFVAGCPLITTEGPGHGPEIDYLQDGVNGVRVRDTDSVDAYAEAAVRVLTDDPWRDRLAAGARRSAGTYTIDNMARHFSGGVVRAVGQAHAVPATFATPRLGRSG
ncbi:MAG: glycosyltransferase family 4 protein [Pseudomonadota bacterium]